MEDHAAAAVTEVAVAVGHVMAATEVADHVTEATAAVVAVEGEDTLLAARLAE